MKKMRSQLYIFMTVFLSQLGLHLAVLITSTSRWLYFSLQFDSVDTAQVKLRAETIIVVQIILELMLDVWLIIYIQQKEDQQSEDANRYTVKELDVEDLDTSEESQENSTCDFSEMGNFP